MTVQEIDELKERVQVEVQGKLMNEMKQELMEQMKTIFANLLQEVKMQLSGGGLPEVANQRGDRLMVRPRLKGRQARLVGPVHQRDAEGRPICHRCGVPGNIQRQCSRRPSRP